MFLHVRPPHKGRSRDERSGPSPSPRSEVVIWSVSYMPEHAF